MSCVFGRFVSVKLQVLLCVIRFTNEEDKTWFEACIGRVVQQELGEEYLEKMAEEPYFVDFLRETPEITGEEPDDFNFEAPKVYEQVRGGTLGKEARSVIPPVFLKVAIKFLLDSNLSLYLCRFQITMCCGRD